jgi:hypothetical protein
MVFVLAVPGRFRCTRWNALLESIIYSYDNSDLKTRNSKVYLMYLLAYMQACTSR